MDQNLVTARVNVDFWEKVLNHNVALEVEKAMRQAILQRQFTKDASDIYKNRDDLLDDVAARLSEQTSHLGVRVSLLEFANIHTNDEHRVDIENIHNRISEQGRPQTTKQTPKFRPTAVEPPKEEQPSSMAYQPPRGFNYERGLDVLSELLPHDDDETRLFFLGLEHRLRENLDSEDRYGVNENVRSERARVVEQLNRLALRFANRGFNDLCRR